MKDLFRKPFSLILLIHLFFCSQVFAQTGSRPLVIGITDSFQSAILKEKRIVNIYLPEDFNPTDSIKYPVIYIPDGGVEEDFIHIVGIVRYNTQSWINRFPKSIVVGIENINRQRDFTFAVANTSFLEKEGFSKERFQQYGGSEKYISFLEKELQPYIEKKYKASSERTIIGESLAGLLAAEILLKHPVLFSHYIIISPSLWWGERDLLKSSSNLATTKLARQLKVYLGVPDKKEDIRMYDDATKLRKKLQASSNIQLIYDYLPDELHSTIIHQAVYNAFKKFYPKTTYSK